MAADPVIYCLQELSDYDQFERLCHDLMMRLGYKDIEPLGGFKDKGRDAVHVSRVTGQTTVFAYSVREDWRKKLRQDASKIRQHGHTCHRLVFVTTEKPTVAERDESIANIRQEYGWLLDLFGIERLRCHLSSDHSDLITRHPQIFPPHFSAHPHDAVRKADLRVHVSPTRSGRRLMAQLQLFNRGASPIYIQAWHASWGPPDRGGLLCSMSCVRGSLPIRLQEQDAYELLVRLDDHPVEDLRELGVRDGEGHLWLAEDQDVRTFIANAVLHEPPEAHTNVPGSDDIAKCDVAVTIERRPRAGRVDLVEIVFRNNGPIAIPLQGALIQWSFHPPRQLPSEPGKPVVAESGGSVGLAARRKDLAVKPAEERRFYLRDELAAVLVEILADDVADDDIAVVVRTETTFGWRLTGEEVASDLRACARSVVASWDQTD